MKFLSIAFLVLLSVSCTKSDNLFIASQSSSDRSNYLISGKIVWEHDDITGVKSVLVTLSGAESQVTTTDVNGNYAFVVSTLGSYTVTPTKTTNKLNGLSSADVIAIQQHVTLINPINDPYKRIASDTYISNTINTLDASIINQALLGNPAALNHLNPSWKFVDASYTLTLPPANQAVPTGYPQSISFVLSADVLNVDFIGIKRGDVNGTCDPSL